MFVLQPVSDVAIAMEFTSTRMAVTRTTAVVKKSGDSCGYWWIHVSLVHVPVQTTDEAMSGSVYCISQQVTVFIPDAQLLMAM